MVAQEWYGSNLQNSVFFEPNEQGIDLFKTYLKSSNHKPIRLLLDLIEEEFRRATLPLVHGLNRKKLIERHLEKFFRHSKFRHAFTQSIEKKKPRKEENLIFMGLSNPGLIEPWLKIIEATKTPLAGIVSLPIISEGFVEQLKSNNKCVILVSQQVQSDLRQTVFVEGKLILSRLAPIASFYHGKYAEDVIRDIDSTQRYLVSQRLIQRSETVSVHILSNNRHFNKLSIACHGTSYFDFKIHNINDLLKEKKINLYEEQDFSAVLFCYEASKIRSMDHYSRQKDKRYLKHYWLESGLKTIGIALFSVGLGLGLSQLIQGYLYQDNIAEMERLKTQYDLQYQHLAEKTKELPATTNDMKLAVDLTKTIKQNYQQSPKKLLTDISQDLMLFADMRVTQINWFVADSEDKKAYNEVDWGQKKAKRGDQPIPPASFKGHYEIVVLDGEFLNFDGNYRYALSILADFENLLKESGKYDAVQVLVQPLNIGKDGTLKGAAIEDKKNKKNAAKFKIKIVKNVPLNA